MHKARFGSRLSRIDIPDFLRASSLLLALLMVIAFFVGCETTKKEQADSNSVLREAPRGGEVHGEVGAMYGRGF
jgi:hypothetical protein